MCTNVVSYQQLVRVWEPGTVTILHHGACVSVAKAIANIATVFSVVSSCKNFPANHNGFCNWIEPRC